MVSGGDHERRIDRWVGVIQSLGVPTVFMLFVLTLVYRHVPPVVDAHIRMLDRTTTTLKSMDQTLTEIQDSEFRQKQFMNDVYDAHDAHCEYLREIRDTMESSHAN